MGEGLAGLLEVAAAAGLAALVEVHDEAEAAAALAAGASIIGVNNRNLTTFVTDLTVAERVAGALPPGVDPSQVSLDSSVAGQLDLVVTGPVPPPDGIFQDGFLPPG